MARVAVLHPGEMGTAVGRALLSAGHEVGWLPAGRGAATAARAREAGFADLDSLAGVDVVISLCPPDAALSVARECADFDGTFVDANATSPDTARAVSQLVAHFVDGSVIGPPPQTAGTTRLYLGGPAASPLAALFDRTVVDVRVLPGEFDASAVKMAYAAWTKISAALLVSARDLAERLGVEQALDAEWALSQPRLDERLLRARRSASAKGWRWAGEMREIAATLVAAGLPGGFGDAAAELYEGYPRPGA